jgi:hypothetical protein
MLLVIADENAAPAVLTAFLICPSGWLPSLVLIGAWMIKVMVALSLVIQGGNICCHSIDELYLPSLLMPVLPLDCGCMLVVFYLPK